VKKKLRLLVAAGPTIEYIDPVRFISNRSSGEMGRALAREAKKRNHFVTLVAGPVSIELPRVSRLIRVETALDLEKALFSEIKKSDCLIMASAVCDFRPASFSPQKVKSKKTLTLKLVRNRDILKAISKKYKKRKILAGFSLETSSNLKNAGDKLRSKSLDLIISNRIDKYNNPFGKGRKEFIILNRSGSCKTLKNASKSDAARAILDSVERLCYTRKN